MADDAPGSPPAAERGAPLGRARVPEWASGEKRGSPRALLAIVLFIATTALVYELSIAAMASYLLGDSVRQFSLVIGAYLSALGVGAYASRYVESRLAIVFVDVELAAAVVGGMSVPCLLLSFAYTHAFELVLFGVVLSVGALVGLELPLLIRILERRSSLRELIARALTFDYAGALLGSLAFSFVLVPKLGLAHTSSACGLVNAAVAFASTYVLPAADDGEASALVRARARAGIVVVCLAALLAFSGRATELSEAAMYPGDVVLARDTPYQRIVFTRHGGALELFLNGNLQLSSADEYRYHEALVHPALSAARPRRRVVVGGGGDGLAVREILKWRDVESVTLVDIDAEMTALARSYPPLRALNGGALDDARVRVVNEDALRYFEDGAADADVVLLDFPDPGTYAVGKLYSAEMYRSVKRRLAPGGALVVQSSSPFLSNATFSCIVRTLEASGFVVRPYQAFVPSFGIWGFALARTEPFAIPSELPNAPLRFLNAAAMAALFDLPRDVRPRNEVAVNRLDNQALVGYYLDEWARWEGR
ncbi:MAG TPA: polyamine aminopropyltransferase [Polyangiaceae bacterium]|nr:polyamine aminopropyltransferase [Polyangiaceae bacterium]